MIDKTDILKLQALPIESVATALGMSVSRHRALCPFHDDSHPSLTFSTSRNRYRCFVCDAHGGVIDLVMRYANLSFVDACSWLAKEFGIYLPELGVSSSKIQVPSNANLNPETADRPMNPETKVKPFDASRYERFFMRPWLSNEARKFLFEERRLDPRVVRYCQLTSWKDKQGVPWLQIPYYSRDGKLIGIQNRNLAFGLRSSKSSSSLSGNISNPSNSQTFQTAPRFRFPQGSQCNLYGLQILNLLKPGEPLFLTEGCSDCWSMLSAGHKAIAIPSATLLTRKDKELLETWNLKHGIQFHMFPDQDEPGERLFLQLREVLPSLVRHQLTKDCKDFSDFYLRKGLGVRGQGLGNEAPGEGSSHLSPFTPRPSSEAEAEESPSSLTHHPSPFNPPSSESG